ncbi:hypothetical protein [Bacteroides cellulosilyticus]|jgi:hypothetical protein|uniref:hypothetical protein n=2 Tax=Bacteroides cellulosilyticus TaxID=246787 RepID=UPI0020654347|nr:MAG TPA: hypothetical protein [Caudoviricetes sp.]
MDIYYNINNDEDLLVLMETEILSSLNDFCLSVLCKGGIWTDVTGKRRGIIESWEDAYRYCIDGYLVLMLVQIIKAGDYKKEVIYNKYREKVYPFLKKYGCSEKVFGEIFQNAWKCRYTDNKTTIKDRRNVEKIKEVGELALRNQPLWLRITNCNIFLFIWSIAVFIGAIYIGDYVDSEGVNSPFIISLFMMYSVFIAAASGADLYSYFIPICIALLMCVFNILFEERAYIAITTCKTWMWMALFYLLGFPILYINYKRMKDAKII